MLQKTVKNLNGLEFRQTEILEFRDISNIKSQNVLACFGSCFPRVRSSSFFQISRCITIRVLFENYQPLAHNDQWVKWKKFQLEDDQVKMPASNCCTSKIRQSTIYYDGLIGRWDTRIVDQESDVPSIIFVYTFYRLRALKILYFYFCNFI